MSFNKEEFMQQNKEDINKIKNQLKKVNFSRDVFGDEDIVYYYDIINDEIFSGKYENLKTDEPFYRFYKTEKEANEYKKFFKILYDLTEKAVIENINNDFDKFVNVKDIHLGDSIKFEVND